MAFRASASSFQIAILLPRFFYPWCKNVVIHMLNGHKVFGKRVKPSKKTVLFLRFIPVVGMKILRKTARKEYCDIMSALCRIFQTLISAPPYGTYRQGTRLKLHGTSQLIQGGFLNPFLHRFPVTNTSPRDVPTFFKKTVISAGKQKVIFLISNEKIHIWNRYQGRYQKKELFWEACACI